MTLTSLKNGIMVIATCGLVGCGMEPSGGDHDAIAAANQSSQPASGSVEVEVKSNPATQNSSDATQAGVAALPEKMKDINTADVTSCQAKGNVYDRRTVRCSTVIRLAASYTCDKAGIAEAFKLTGFQIEVALQTAEKDGFVLDQCGETESGRRIAYFVRADEDATYSLREIETKQNVK